MPTRARSSRPRRCFGRPSAQASGRQSGAVAWWTRHWAERSWRPATVNPAPESHPRRWPTPSPVPRRGDPARPRPEAEWRSIEVDEGHRGTIRRPPGLIFDTGGSGKGLAADLVAEHLRGYSRFVVDCGGDVSVGGYAAGLDPFAVHARHPLDDEPAAIFDVPEGGIATSGLDVRLWRREEGSFAHHLLDPGTGEPAWTGLVGVTALGRTALEAETLSKAALLSGPGRGRELLAEHRRDARARRRTDRDRRARPAEADRQAERRSRGRCRVRLGEPAKLGVRPGDMTPEPSERPTAAAEPAVAEEAIARLNDVQRVTESALAYLDLDDLLNELLERVVEILAGRHRGDPAGRGGRQDARRPCGKGARGGGRARFSPAGRARVRGPRGRHA